MADKDFVLACSKTATSFRYRIMFACPVQWAITATRLNSTGTFRKANRNACSNWSRISYAIGEPVIHSFCAFCWE